MAQGVRRYDVGNFESYMRTFIEFALEDDVLGTEMRAFVRGLLAGRRD
jgi:UTP-glucose-1-phosphate uridylyltransferase